MTTEHLVSDYSSQEMYQKLCLSGIYYRIHLNTFINLSDFTEYQT